ncbi:MAG: class I SAM-dependent methyltransferase [Polyangiaceae bacterium]
MTPRVAQLYALLHRGTPGDLEFYRSCCAGGARVLELGSGAGRVAMDLAARGHAVTGIDIEPALIDVAREQARALEPGGREQVRFVRADMRDFDLTARFDRVIIPFNALCCLLTPTDLERTLAAARRHLEPDGLVAFDIYRGDPDATVDEGETHLIRVEHAGEGWDVYERARADHDPFRADTCYRFVATHDGEEQHLVIPQRLIADDEVEDALANAGLAPVERHGGFRGESLDDESAHLVVVARAPHS